MPREGFRSRTEGLCLCRLKESITQSSWEID